MHEVQSLLQFPCVFITTLELRIGSITFGNSPTYQPVSNPSEYTAKQVAYLPDSYSRREPNLRTLSVVFFGTAEPIPQSASPSHLKTEKSENNLRLCGKFLAEKLKVLFFEGDDTGTFIVPALDVRSQVHSMKDRRNGAGKPSVQTCTIWKQTGVCSLSLCSSSACSWYSLMCCNRSSLKPAIWLRIARAICDVRPFASLLFRCVAGRGPFFRGFTFSVGFTICALSGSMPGPSGRSTLQKERFSVRMRSPARHLVVPFLHCPLASAKSICIDAGTANQRYQF